MSKPFYVYVLKDDAGRPFYVGKGSGPRVLAHLFHEDKAGGEAKQATVRVAKESGRGLVIEIVGWFATDREAREREHAIITRLGLAREGGALVNRNRSGTGENSCSVRLTAKARAVLEPIARRENRSLAAQLEVLIREGMERRKVAA